MSECSQLQEWVHLLLIISSYSDDEDTSYKIRRSATKLLAAVIGTRPELLVALYKDVSPVLISRFGDREETVRLEVWATYGVLLNQTKVYAGLPQAKDAEYSIGGKRKRDEVMDVEETPLTLLHGQISSLARSLLNQLKSLKTSAATLQAGFSLLNSLLSVLPGCLAAHAPQIISNTRAVLIQSSTTAANLQVSCLSFLGVFFTSHPPHTFTGSLDSILPQLLKSLTERHPRITSEGFRTFSSLLIALKPVKGSPWAEKVYSEAVSRLSNHDTDAEVRACAEKTIGDLWISATDLLRTKDKKEWDAMCRTSGRTEGAVEVVTRVAREVEMDSVWVSGCIDWVLNLLKRSGRSGKNDLFVCLDALLRR